MISQIPYADLADALTNLPAAVRQELHTARLSHHKAAAEIGCSRSTIRRVELGHDFTVYTAVQVLRWLDKRAQRKAVAGV